MSATEEPEDGPWRIALRFHVAVRAAVGDLGAAASAARLAAAFGEAGLPIAEARAVPPGGMHAFLRRAAASRVDALVLDARTLIEPAAVAELRRVAGRDPMIAAVRPPLDVSAERHVPGRHRPLDYGLLPDDRCTYVKTSTLGLLGDEAAWGGGDGLAGPMTALNRMGFRVAVAGRAVALHPGGPARADPAGLPPDWRPALARHRASATSLAEALMGGLRPGPDGRRAVAFDLGHLGPRHNGTTGLARALVRRAAARWQDLALHAIATPEAFAFHLGDLGTAVARTDPADERTFGALIRFGQPFLWGEMEAATRRAPVLVIFMLDTIGLDCQRDAPDELDALWRFCLAEADGILFNSAFTARQFERRFTQPSGRAALASLHSLALDDYRIATVPDAPPDGTILLVGNGMPHKRLGETAAYLAAARLGRPLTALGLAPGAVPGVACAGSGDVAPDRVASLYAAARVVVYPSVYEGFGFPLLDALAHRRPILVRDLPPYREIAAGLPERANIHRFADDADLLRLLADPPAWTDERAEVTTAQSWDAAAADLRTVLDAAVAGADRDRVVRRIDALRGRMGYMRARAFGDAEGADDLDRLAGLSGRMAQAGVLWLGRHLPGTRTLLAAAHRGLDRLRRRGGRRG